MNGTAIATPSRQSAIDAILQIIAERIVAEHLQEHDQNSKKAEPYEIAEEN